MNTRRFIMTSSQRGTEVPEAGRTMAQSLGIEVVKRERRSISSLEQHYCADGVIVWQETGPIVHIAGQKFFFHPSMAKARISMLKKGLIQDPLLAAMDIEPGDSVLDCTLGLGADAIVASFAVGEKGKVTGIEKSPLVAAIVAYGLAHYSTEIKNLSAAMKRIQVINAEHLNYLSGLPDQAYDIVYFDPMFRNPVNTSTGIKPMRLLADPDPLTCQAISEGLRVARKRVVVKERQGSPEFNRLGCERVEGGASSPIAYGIWETGR